MRRLFFNNLLVPPAVLRCPGMSSDWQAGPPTKTFAPSAPSVSSGLSLLVVRGPDRGRSLLLVPGTFSVGKHADCALTLTDPGVSRRHFDVVVDATGIHLRDAGSKNGTFLGGLKVGDCELAEGAMLRIGSTLLQLTATATAEARDRFGDLLGASAKMQEIYGLLERVAPTNATVLIVGETGSGKELCAQALHHHSGRKGPFAVCDLAGVTRSLIESELFGHEKGAFTGAVQSRDGAFMQAHGGTLFIDEIGELETESQPRLLRALQERQVKPVGSTRYRDFDVRVIAATNRDLTDEVRQGRFRQDLFHRLAVVRIRLPPLRERKEDLPMLVRHFIAHFAADGVGRAVTVPPATLAVLAGYDWPGNVRELQNTIERALAVLAPGATELGPELLGLELAPGTAPVVEEGDFQTAKERLISTWERAYLEKLLRAAGGNVSEAARQGGIARIYLHRLLKKHNLRADRSKP